MRYWRVILEVDDEAVQRIVVLPSEIRRSPPMGDKRVIPNERVDDKRSEPMSVIFFKKWLEDTKAPFSYWLLIGFNIDAISFLDLFHAYIFSWKLRTKSSKIIWLALMERESMCKNFTLLCSWMIQISALIGKMLIFLKRFAPNGSGVLFKADSNCCFSNNGFIKLESVWAYYVEKGILNLV